MATHFSILAWRIPQTEEPGRLHTVQGVARVGHDLATKPPPAPKMWYIHTVEYYSIIKKNEIMPFAATWSYKSVILSEVSQTEKEKYHKTSFI